LDTILLEELTSPQVRQLMTDGYRTVVVCAGSIEQHGKHLPLGTDTLLGYDLAEGLARELGHSLVAPVIRPGCSDHHMAFAGSLTISKELLGELLQAYCRALAHHGFDRIVVISSHGGNNSTIKAVTPEIDAELRPACRAFVVEVEDEDSLTEAAAALQRNGVTPEEGGSHSGFTETSMVLASKYAWCVDMSVAERGFVGDGHAAIQAATRDGKWRIDEISPIGVLGDPVRANAQAGKDMMHAIAVAMADVARKAMADLK
jgi:creatinine amidohydrolase